MLEHSEPDSLTASPSGPFGAKSGSRERNTGATLRRGASRATRTVAPPAGRASIPAQDNAVGYGIKSGSGPPDAVTLHFWLYGSQFNAGAIAQVRLVTSRRLRHHHRLARRSPELSCHRRVLVTVALAVASSSGSSLCGGPADPEHRRGNTLLLGAKPSSMSRGGVMSKG
jgi:hypothetical protein